MPIGFTLRQLEYFIAVGEEGSIAAAAAQQNISSPSISSAIRHLEEQFGLQLFVRKHGQGLTLTQGGRDFMRTAKKVLAVAEDLNGLADDISGKVQGPLSVGCLSTFAQLVLPQLRRGFERRYPKVTFRQFEMNQVDIIKALKSALVDVALTYDLGIPTEIAFAPMLSLPPYAMMAPSHPLAGRSRLTPEDLCDHPMVLLDLPASSEYFLSFFTRAGLKPRVAERTRDIAVMRSLIANGYGYGMANIRAFSALSPDGKPLVYVPLSGSLRPVQMGLAMPSGLHQSRTVQAFSSYCNEIISLRQVPGLNVEDLT